MTHFIDLLRSRGAAVWAKRVPIAVGLLIICLIPLGIFSFVGLPASIMAAGLVAFSLRHFQAGLAPLLRTPALIALGAFFCWALLSVLWGPDIAYGLQSQLRIILILAFTFAVLSALAALRPADLKGLKLILYGVFAAVGAIYLFEIATTGAIYRVVAFYDVGPTPGFVTDPNGRVFPREHMITKAAPGALFISTLIWPLSRLIAAETGRRWPAVVAVLAGGAIVAGLNMEAAKLAFCVGGVVFAAALMFGRTAGRVFTLFAGAGVMLAPWAALGLAAHMETTGRVHAIPGSWAQRLFIYEYVADHALEKPVAGHGFAAARYMSPEAPRRELQQIEGHVVSSLPLHPHNYGLQIWLELGAVGAAIATAFLVFFGRLLSPPASAARPRGVLAGRLSAFGAVLTFSSVSFGVWQYHWITAICIVVVLTRLMEILTDRALAKS